MALMFHGFLLSCHRNGIILEQKEKYRNQPYAINNIQQHMAYCSVYCSPDSSIDTFEEKVESIDILHGYYNCLRLIPLLTLYSVFFKYFHTVI